MIISILLNQQPTWLEFVIKTRNWNNLCEWFEWNQNPISRQFKVESIWSWFPHWVSRPIRLQSRGTLIRRCLASLLNVILPLRFVHIFCNFKVWKLKSLINFANFRCLIRESFWLNFFNLKKISYYSYQFPLSDFASGSTVALRRDAWRMKDLAEFSSIVASTSQEPVQLDSQTGIESIRLIYSVIMICGLCWSSTDNV